MKKFSNWKLLADLNISIGTINFLSSLGVEIKRIDKSLSTDEDVVNLAQKEDRIIITFDKDFGEIYYLNKKKEITVIVLNLQDQTTESVNKYVEKFLSVSSSDKIKKKLVILYEYKYKVIG